MVPERHHFSSTDQLKCAATTGALPMLCSPVISNVQVTKTLIDGNAGLNVLSVDTFDSLQVPYDQLQPTKPFSGVTDGSTTPIGQVRLPVTSTLHTSVCHTTPSSGIQPSPSSWQ